MTNDKKENVNFKEMYGKATILKPEEIISEQKINLEKGLSKKQVKDKIDKYGYNIISKSKEKKWYNYFFESLFAELILIYQ